MHHLLPTIAGLLTVAAFARAQSLVPELAADIDPVEAPAEADAASRFSLDLSLTYTTDYFFRGIAQRTDSFNLQPSAELRFRLAETGDVSLSLIGGTWSNFSDGRADGAADRFREYWYEHDTYIGLSVGVSRITIEAVYTWYASPSSDFTDYEDLTLSLSYDDSGLWDKEGRFSINPGVFVAFETRNAALGPNSGVWLGIGIEPTFALGESFLGPTTLSFPLGVGLSVDDYYQRADGTSDTFGYAEVGVTLSFDMSTRFGEAAPTLDVGVSYLMLGGVLDDLNDGDSAAAVFTVGLSWSF